jgi:RHS repeat-associated protein
MQNSILNTFTSPLLPPMGSRSLKVGFNGEFNDEEIKGEGNSYDYGNRFYDPRLGKFLSVDPLASKYPAISPYTFAYNSPIRARDMGGDSVLFYSESGSYLGYSHDNVRYKDKNLLVVINDKEIKTFRKEYERKRSKIYQKENKLSKNQKEYVDILRREAIDEIEFFSSGD